MGDYRSMVAQSFTDSGIIAQRILEELGAEDFSTLLSLIQFGVEMTYTPFDRHAE